MNYSFVQNIKIISGIGCLSQLGELLYEEGFKTPFVVCDSIVRDLGVISKIEKYLDKYNISCVIYDKVQVDPPSEIIDAGARLCIENQCDCVIAIGGGSAIDTGKGINLLRFNHGSILDYADPSKSRCESKGLIAIPTTAGTGSELSNGLIVTDSKNNAKIAIIEYSEYAVIDPELTMSMPKGLTINTGLDVFSHAFEAYTSVLSNDLADSLCEKIMADVFTYLPKVISDSSDIEARKYMAVSASLGGFMLSNACAHVGHSLAHVIGAKYHVPHGLACSYSLPAVMEFISEEASEKIKKVGIILGAEFSGTETAKEIGVISANSYKRFRDTIIGADNLKKYNLNSAEIPSCAEEVLKDIFAGFTPRKVEVQDAKELLRKSFF